MAESQTVEGAETTAADVASPVERRHRHRRRMTSRERFERHLEDYVGGQMYVTNEAFDPFKAKPGDGAYCGTIEAIAFEGDILNIRLSWAAKKRSGMGWDPHDRLDYSFRWGDYAVGMGEFREYRLSSRVSNEAITLITKWAPYKVEPPDE